MFGLLALVAASLFTGAAFYINFAEQPARLQIDDAALLTEWKTAYKAGFMMQASLAVIAGVFGILEWLVSGSMAWLLGALVILANWPYTLLVIMPVNRRVEAIALADAGAQSRALIYRWGGLHAVRTLFGALATIIFLWAAL